MRNPILILKHVVLAINCEWADWVAGNCSSDCGEGAMNRKREKIVTEVNGGICKGNSTEIVQCKEKECLGR